jgi:DNA-binding MarR family transcriptional regulator
VPDPADRRAQLLALTPARRRLRNQVRRDIRRAEQRILKSLPTEERGVFLRALGRLATEAARSTEAQCP